MNEDPNRRGIYFVEYQIVSAGTYQMTVTVNGEPIPGSPFTVIAVRDNQPVGFCGPV